RVAVDGGVALIGVRVVVTLEVPDVDETHDAPVPPDSEDAPEQVGHRVLGREVVAVPAGGAAVRDEEPMARDVDPVRADRTVAGLLVGERGETFDHPALPVPG